ncbi:MAG: hypothetical protein B6D58_06660 [candidate division Zixibacteria bacterium 4484_95]|nr:MAG: hypothetical protein B6D58_06660 [candidate division Zixibacteria bacterium 4484_95]
MVILHIWISGFSKGILIKIHKEAFITKRFFRFRDDLEISQQESFGVKFYIIKDPISGKFYRLKEREYFIANLFDGRNDVDTIAEKFSAEFNLKINAEQIEIFGKKLSDTGLVEKMEFASKPTGIGRKRSLLGKLLFIKIKAFNPEKLVERTYKLARPFYSKSAVKLYILLVILAAVTTIANYTDLKNQALRFFVPGIIPLVWVTILFVTLLHEMSHTYSCRLQGGRVTDMGFLLLYFQPCFYSNVSDAYLFPERKKRIAVTIAGIISQIVVWALAVYIWRITSTDNIINSIAFIVIVLSFIGITFNLNPLLKLDGYYFLVDFWEIPNLRYKAFLFLRQKLLGLAPDEQRLQVTRREQKIFLYYGTAALIYSGILIGYIVYRVGKFINGQFGVFGVVFLAMVLLYLVFDAMNKGKIFQVAYNQRGAILKPGRLLTSGAVLVVILLALIFIKAQLRITNNCLILPLEQVNLRSTSPGSVELLVERANEKKRLKQFQLVGQDFSVLSIDPKLKVGDTVKSGDLIASIESNIYESQKLERYANLQRARRQLDLLEKGPQIEEVKQTEDIIKQVRLKFEKSSRDLLRAESLFAKGMISADEIDDTRTANQVLKSELDFYKNQLALLKRGARPEELDMARAQVSQLEAKLKHMESQLEQTIIESPIDGIVTKVNEDNTIISIARLDTVRVRIYVPEKEISVVSAGNKVKMKVRSFPGLVYSGIVTRIDPLVVDDTEQKPVIVVTANVANSEGLLKPGMTGKAKINCGKKPLYRLILWRLVRYLRVEFWSWW